MTYGDASRASIPAGAAIPDRRRRGVAPQSGITWMGHATVLVELGGVRLLTDPVLRGRVAHLRRHGPSPGVPGSLDAVLLSHLHHDHADRASLRLLDSGVRVLAPRGARAWLRRAGFRRVEELAPGEEAEVGSASVAAVPAVHDPRRRPFGGPRADPIGFLLRSEQRVYFAGDTDIFAGMTELRPLDLALLPIAGWGPRLGPGHLDPERATRAAAMMRPRMVVPIHWGTLRPRLTRIGRWFSDPPNDFAAQMAELAPDIEVHVIAPGDSLELSA
jgi:L-ascorbate metabolism protein UlaG (beta-lactamase superfamily)